MANTPKFDRPQGTSSTTSLNLTSTIRNQVLTGTLDSNTVDVQVNVNGAGFVSDPALVEFDQETFTVPNRNVYPEGLQLSYGKNTIKVRVVDVTGATSTPAEATLNILRPDDVSLISEAPSGLRVRRQRGGVELVWSELDVPNVRGYNVYASAEPSGGTSGYVRINKDLITDASFEEEELEEVTTDSTFYDNNFGQLRVFLSEEDFNEEPIQTVQDSTIDTSLAGTKLKVDTTVSTVTTTTYYAFTHDRDGTESGGFINNEVFADVPDDDPLYYVMTSVVFDPVTNREVESAYSAELVGYPLVIDTQIRELPRRTNFDVSEDYISEILEYDNEISVIPGSVVRDVFIDPFATEAERLYFIADFVRRSQSFATLLVVDELTSYKEALASSLGLTSIDNVQSIIDDAFDKLAANVNVTRQGSSEAVGEVTFYTTSEPQTDLTIEEGTLVGVEGGGVTFRVTSRVVLPVSDKESYYNHQRRRWEIKANIRATEAGSQGNVPSTRIRRVIGNASGLQVTNFEATRFGRDEESNEDLAERAILAFTSVDVGTSKGYLATALKQQGVFRASVIDAGDDYMARDYDEVREKNIGGKVDVWVQGNRDVEVSDTFALKFDIERDVRFFLDSSPSEYIFIADDDRITPNNPIVQVLGETPSEQAQGFQFRNLTTGENFDLTNYSILDYNKIQLDTSITQPVVRSNDVISGDFRFQESSQYVFSRQPVVSINNVTSLNTSDVLTDGTHYQLCRIEDPLLTGHSTEAEDYMQVSKSGGVPSGQVFVVNDERHVLVGELSESLDNLGASSLTVRVFTLDRMTEYNGPLSSDPDFFIEEGDSTTPLKIVRNPDGDITNGEEVSVDYEHDENFDVSYTINDILTDVQAEFEKQRHVTADVLAKQAVSNQIDLEMTIVLVPNATQSQVDAEIRTNISQLLNSKAIGDAIHQSDIVRVIENTPGVSHVIMPFAKMTHADNNLIVRESVNNAFTFLENSPTSKIYTLQDALNFATTDGGGSESLHRGVFQDRQPLELVSAYSALRSKSNAAYIVGSEGLVITGYSDDSTLTSEGYNTATEREARRKELTANHVFLSLPSTGSPENHEYTASYQVKGDTSSQSTIELTGISFAELGDLTITYRGGVA